MKWINDYRMLSELVAWELNPRQINQDQARRLRQSLSEFGQVLPICIDPNNMIIDGHQRKEVWSMADEFGPEYVVDVRIAERELTQNEQLKLSVFLEKAKGDWDFEMLANIGDVDDLLDWGFTERELDLNLWASSDLPDDPGAEINRADELREKWQTESGQLWQLGDHRLICGDCTDVEVVERLMDVKKINILLADPPYGMGLDTDFKKWPVNIDNVLANTFPLVEGDNEPFDWMGNVVGVNEIDEQFWWGGDWYYENLPSGGSWIVWDKRNENTDNMIGNTFELCWSKKRHRREIIRHYWIGVINKDAGEKYRYHPTQKPAPVMEFILMKYSEIDHIVYDPFLGSGTTIIACERLNRKCRAIEIMPAYVAVALERWANMTGKTPILINE